MTKNDVSHYFASRAELCFAPGEVEKRHDGFFQRAASGQVLLAVGTGALASALSKGGAIARSAGGAILVHDTAGNAVGVVQGVYDATQNGFDVANGAKIAGSVLGLGANAKYGRDIVGAAKVRHLAQVEEFVKALPRKTTPTRTPADLYEVKHTGPYNYTLSGGGAKFDIDGYHGSTILDAKHVGNAKSSPYVPGSSCPEPVRDEILKGVRDELNRVRTIIKSGSTPFRELKIVTNSPEAIKFFEELLREARVPGNVQLKP